MAERPTKVVVDLSKPAGQRETIVELTDEEIAERTARAEAAAEEEAARVAEEERIAALKASAKQKLISGETLTEEEADTLVI